MREWLGKCLLAATLCAAMVNMAATAQALPPVVSADAPALKPLGDGTMRFLGMRVYDVSLWTTGKAFSYLEPFALQLTYHMNFAGKDIAERSIKEMRGLGYNDEAKLKRWLEEMSRVFPDIKKGDTLVGVNVPGKEARFYSRDKFISAIADPEFTKAFFDIWLSEKTSDPGVRTKLLGPAK